MFKDGSGDLSTMRVCMFLIVAVVLGVYIAQNVVSMIHGQGLISMGIPEISALGLAMTGKVVQNFTENSSGRTLETKPFVDSGTAKTPE